MGRGCLLSLLSHHQRCRKVHSKSIVSSSLTQNGLCPAEKDHKIIGVVSTAVIIPFPLSCGLPDDAGQQTCNPANSLSNVVIPSEMWSNKLIIRIGSMRVSMIANHEPPASCSCNAHCECATLQVGHVTPCIRMLQAVGDGLEKRALLFVKVPRTWTLQESVQALTVKLHCPTAHWASGALSRPTLSNPLLQASCMKVVMYASIPTAPHGSVSCTDRLIADRAFTMLLLRVRLLRNACGSCS